jgi:hypothetical protein
VAGVINRRELRTFIDDNTQSAERHSQSLAPALKRSRVHDDTSTIEEKEESRVTPG